MGTRISDALVPEGLLYDPNLTNAYGVSLKKDSMTTILKVAKLLATLAKKTGQALISCQLECFDPIVHENSCQIRALFAIRAAENEELIEEARTLIEQAEEVERIVQPLMSSLKRGRFVLPGEARSVAPLLEEYDLSISASDTLIYLMRAYYLTASKTYQVRADGSERCSINLQRLCDLLGARYLQGACRGDDSLMGRMKRKAQSDIAASSIAYIQNVSEELFEAEAALVAQQLADENIRYIWSESAGLHERCSCAYYNLRAILLDLRQRQTLVILKPHVTEALSRKRGKRKKQRQPKAPYALCYRSPSPGTPFQLLNSEEVVDLSSEEPAFIIKGLLPEEETGRDSLIEQVERVGGLQELVLLGVARKEVTQYGIAGIEDLPGEEDSIEREWFEEHRTRAEELGCTDLVDERRIYTVIHTYANSVGRERELIEEL